MRDLDNEGNQKSFGWNPLWSEVAKFTFCFTVHSARSILDFCTPKKIGSKVRTGFSLALVAFGALYEEYVLARWWQIRRATSMTWLNAALLLI